MTNKDRLNLLARRRVGKTYLYPSYFNTPLVVISPCLYKFILIRPFIHLRRL